MARILVADDNSNIQKMVGLALKDQGIDVVAVGNGEAAVRKIADVKPDLVLADVFMPVRNGYEVCKFVKDDSTLSHIPVILLVGAFDPLDEQEAQRVGADGVLKKPFVPPDPLISMVKSALIRAGSAQASAAAAKLKAPAAGASPAEGSATTSSVAPAVMTATNDTVVSATENFVEDIPARTPTLKIDAAGQPLAFGSLLETPSTETEEEAAYIAPVNSELADRDWQDTDDAEETDEEEDAESASWRRDGGNEFDEEPQSVTEKPARKKKEAWTPTREKKQDLIEAAALPEPEVIPEIKASKPVAPLVTDSWAKAVTPSAAKVTVPEKEPALKAKDPNATTEYVAAPDEPAKVTAPMASTAETPVKEAEKPSGANAWFSTSSSPWEAEAQKATHLASTWDSPNKPATPVVDEAPMVEEVPAAANEEKFEPAGAIDAMPSDFVSEAPSEEPVHYTADPALVTNERALGETLPDLITDSPIPAATVETIRQETTQVLENVVQQVEEASKGKGKEKPQAAEPDMEALVAKVLAKLSPEMLQAVTREILKPVVEAMVRDEVTKKP